MNFFLLEYDCNTCEKYIYIYMRYIKVTWYFLEKILKYFL